MGRVAEYRETLRSLADWEPYLREHSGLPGPRANLELVWAATEEGTTDRFLRFLEHDREEPDGLGGEFLAVCGAAGLGKSVAEGATEHWATLRSLASDPRWRVREGVVFALQRIGDGDRLRLLDGVRPWLDGNPLERRAVAAGLCEPRLLADGDFAGATLEILDRLTRSLADEPASTPDVRVLRKGLGYCWSVAVAALPDEGLGRFGVWLDHPHPDVRWVVRENLRKKRLQRLDHPGIRELLDRAG